MNQGICAPAYQFASPTLQLLGRPTPAPAIHRHHHPEANDWQDRVVANGGSASHQTMAAVSDFCRAVDAAGLRRRFYRLNLVCGQGLASALVPLYRGPSPSESTFGYATDTNFNFVSSDYVEYGLSGGLATGLGGKWLQTGLGTASYFSAFDGISLGMVVSATASNLGNFFMGAVYSGQANIWFGRNNEMQSNYGNLSSPNSAPFRDRRFMNTVSGLVPGAAIRQNYVCVAGLNGGSFGQPSAGTAGFIAVGAQATSDTTAQFAMFNGRIVMYSMGGLLLQHMTVSMDAICRNFMAAMGRVT